MIRLNFPGRGMTRVINVLRASPAVDKPLSRKARKVSLRNNQFTNFVCLILPARQRHYCAIVRVIIHRVADRLVDPLAGNGSRASYYCSQTSEPPAGISWDAVQKLQAGRSSNPDHRFADAEQCSDVGKLLPCPTGYEGRPDDCIAEPIGSLMMEEEGLRNKRKDIYDEPGPIQNFCASLI